MTSLTGCFLLPSSASGSGESEVAPGEDHGDAGATLPDSDQGNVPNRSENYPRFSTLLTMLLLEYANEAPTSKCAKLDMRVPKVCCKVSANASFA